MITSLAKKIIASLRFRTQYALAMYMRSVAKKSTFICPPLKEQCDLSIVTMTGAAHLDMLKECLYSILKTWSYRPHIIVISDGSISCSSIAEELSWVKGSIEVRHIQEIIDDYEKLGEIALVRFANNHPFGKKLAIICHYGSQTPVLWTDSDILWFGMPSTPIQVEKGEISLSVAQDIQPSYCPELLKEVEALQSAPYLNAGVVFLYGNLLSNCWFRGLLDTASVKTHYFSEQTMFAAAAKMLGNFWTLDEIHLSLTDVTKIPFTPTKVEQTWKAKHYPGPSRNQFWRDALELRRNSPQFLKAT